MQIVIDIEEKTYKRIQALVRDDYFEHDICGYSMGRIANGTLLPKGNKCKWVHYDYRTICPEEHDINNPYWRIPENRMDVLRYCPYCGKEIEIEADKEE